MSQHWVSGGLSELLSPCLALRTVRVFGFLLDQAGGGLILGQQVIGISDRPGGSIQPLSLSGKKARAQ